MANKERNKRSARKARALEREQRDEQLSEVTSKPQASVVKASSRNENKPKRQSRLGAYLSDVRTEMHRVTWPSKEELKSYSIAVVCMLIVFGIVVWAVDTLITGGIAGITGIRTW